MIGGETLGHYEIKEPLGAGGMGEVYRARDTHLDRDVAIKVLPEDFARDSERLARFEREAKLLASLNHPNIATIYGFEESDGVRFIAMEVVEGETLAERIQGRGPIEVDEALKFARQIAEALEAAHEAGVVHRDLKPANVKVTPTGQVKVLDFGLAKSYASDAASGDLDISHSPTIMAATGTGVIMGTAAYMSPEQAKGKPLDKRTDIWAFGCVLYEMLTGRRAFEGDSVTELLASVLKEEPDWDGLPNSVPAAVRMLLRRCLRKDPSRRLHDIADARIEIDEAVSGEEPQLAATSTPGRFSVGWLAAAVGAGGLVVALAWWAFGGAETHTDDATPAPLLRTQYVTPPGVWLSGSQFPIFTVSPDGQMLAYVAYEWDGAEVGRQGLYLRDMEQASEELIPGTEGAHTPFFSPDGRWVAFINGDRLWKLRMGSTTPTLVADAERVRGATWADEETIVLGSLYGGLRGVSTVSGEVRPLTDPGPGVGIHIQPSAIPGSSDVLFAIAANKPAESSSIALLSMRSGDYRILLDPAGRDPFYALSGHLLFGSRGTLYATAFDAVAGTLTGSPEPVIGEVRQHLALGTVYASASDNGVLVYERPRQLVDNEPVEVDLSGGVRSLGVTPGQYGQLRLSRDGRILVAEKRGAWEPALWIRNLVTGQERVEEADKINGWPVLDYDGSDVFFGRVDDDERAYWQIHRRQLDVADSELLIAGSLVPGEDGGVNIPWDISPDGEWLVYHQYDASGGTDLWIASVEDPTVRRPLVSQLNVGHDVASFSPDGEWVLFQSNETGTREVWVVRSEDGSGKRQLSTDGGTWPRWGPAGDRIYYQNSGWLVSVPFSPGTGQPTGAAQRLFEFDERTWWGQWDVLPDDRGFVMLREVDELQPINRLEIVTGWFDELRRKVPTGR